ncbi:BatD family protein [Thalassotalea crassostreae]|uniref:BatD family protein n=1 Tax=Thalassotalea crassostreae TaxID=1763536 RepID=UPI0008385A0E|nr:BatD family protein [Thalassotalea crassostreae]
MQHFNQLHLLLSRINVNRLCFSLPCVYIVLFALMLCTIGNVIASPLAANTKVNAKESTGIDNETDWQLYLQAPKQKLWQGQSSQWLLISLNPPSSKPQLKLPQSSDFEMVQSSPIAINQDNQTGWAYPINITANKAETLTIPAITLSYPNQSLSTPIKKVNVNAAKLTNKIKLEVTSNKQDIYLGQSIRLTTSVTLDYPVAALVAVNLRLPALVDEDLVVTQPWDKADDKDNKSIGLPVNGQRQIAKWQSLEGNKVKIQFTTIIKPKVAGTYSLAPATLYANVIDHLLLKPKKKFKGTQYVAYYNNNFFEEIDSNKNSHRVFTSSEPLSLNVKALPNNAPSNFSGIIGRPIIEASAAPTSVMQGEPLNYLLNIIHPDIETFDLPPLSKIPSFTQSFNLPGDASTLLTKTGTLTVNQSLFPRRPDIQVIPEFTLTYFEPKTGIFRDVVINNVPIQVTENSRFTFSDIETNDGVSLKNKIIVDEQGIWALRWQKSSENNGFNNSKPLLEQTWFILVLLLLPPVVALIMMLRPMRNRLNQRRALQPAYQLKKGLTQAKTIKSCDALLLLSRYCEQRFALPPSQFDANNVKRSITLCLDSGSRSANIQSNSESKSIIESLTAWIEDYQQRYGEVSTPATQQQNTQLLDIIELLEGILPPYIAQSVAPTAESQQIRKTPSISNSLIVLLVFSLTFLGHDNQAIADDMGSADSVKKINIEELHQDHQRALQLDIDSPHKGNLAHAKIAQQLSTFIGDESLNQTSLMYDIGTSWFQASRYGQSILWLRRAENQALNDEIISHNLNQARLKRLDQLPNDFAPPWLSKLHSMTNHPLWLACCWFTYCFAWLLIWRRLSNENNIVNAKHIQLAVLLLSIAILSQVARFNFKPEQSTAVVTSQEITSRKGPGLIFAPAFTTPLHAGTELRILKTDGLWSEVKLTNGAICWLPNRAYTKI